MSKSFVRSALTSLVLCGVLVLLPATAETQRDTSSADARLRALYTEEWNWRLQEMARSSDAPGEAGASDHFPRVNAASQQARLAYWTRTLATLGSIPLDELSPEEKVNAQVFRASIRALSNDLKFRTYEAPFNSDTFFWTDFTPRQGFVTVERVSRLSGPSSRRAALLRRADRQYAGRPGARFYRAARVGRRA